MAGVENIINEILQEAKGQADEIISQADSQAEAAREKARKESEQTARVYQDKADRDSSDYASRIQSQIGLRRRQAILSVKQEIISDIISKAYTKINEQDDASYFAMIGKMLKKVIRPMDGTISFSKKDLSRLPSGYAEKIAQMAKETGGSLQISDEAADIESGFVLSYGGIDENCSIKALFDEKLNDLQDEVHKALW